jgi:hypothetical protein
MSPKSLAFLIRTPPLLLAFSAWRQVCTRFCFYASSAMTVPARSCTILSDLSAYQRAQRFPLSADHPVDHNLGITEKRVDLLSDILQQTYCIAWCENRLALRVRGSIS